MSKYRSGMCEFAFDATKPLGFYRYGSSNGRHGMGVSLLQSYVGADKTRPTLQPQIDFVQMRVSQFPSGSQWKVLSEKRARKRSKSSEEQKKCQTCQATKGLGWVTNLRCGFSNPRWSELDALLSCYSELQAVVTKRIGEKELSLLTVVTFKRNTLLTERGRYAELRTMVGLGPGEKKLVVGGWVPFEAPLK